MPQQALEGSVKVKPVVLSQEQIQFYDDNGYLIVPDVFDDEACEKIKREAEAMADRKEYHALLNIHRNNDLFLNLMKDPVLVRMVKTLQRAKVVGLNDQYFFKKVGTPYAKQGWNPHQDVTYIGAKDGTYIQLHIFLVRSEKENGGLYYFPGSHKEPKLPYEYRKSWREEFDEDGISRPGWLIKEVPPQYQKADIVGPKGGICFQHGNVIHGSYPNLSQNRSREQYSIAYLNEGTEHLRGRSSVKMPVAVE
jgi:ectoine hydroxylase